MLCKSIFYKIIFKNIFVKKLQDVVKEKIINHRYWDFESKPQFYRGFVQIFHLIFLKNLLIIRPRMNIDLHK